MYMFTFDVCSCSGWMGWDGVANDSLSLYSFWSMLVYMVKRKCCYNSTIKRSTELFLYDCKLGCGGILCFMCSILLRNFVSMFTFDRVACWENIDWYIVRLYTLFGIFINEKIYEWHLHIIVCFFFFGFSIKSFILIGLHLDLQ